MSPIEATRVAVLVRTHGGRALWALLAEYLWP